MLLNLLYLGAYGLIAWSVVYLLVHLVRAVRGKAPCSCGKCCGGAGAKKTDCAHCPSAGAARDAQPRP